NPAGSWTWTEDYIYGARGLLAANRPNGFRHFHLDHLGTPRLMTLDTGASTAPMSTSQHDYMPFGLELTSMRQDVAAGDTREEPMKFTGHQRDFTGGLAAENEHYLDYMHARYYNPTMGRFLSVDPVLSKGALRSPQLWNRYAYVA